MKPGACALRAGAGGDDRLLPAAPGCWNSRCQKEEMGNPVDRGNQRPGSRPLGRGRQLFRDRFDAFPPRVHLEENNQGRRAADCRVGQEPEARRLRPQERVSKRRSFSYYA